MSGRSPLYRVGAPIPIVPRTRCDECRKPTHSLWLKDGKSICTDCRKKQPATVTCLCCQGNPCVCGPPDAA